MMHSKFIFVSLIVAGLFNQLAAGNISGNVTTKGARNRNIVIVYIENVDSTYEAPKELALMDQVKLSFKPHVLPIIVGTTVKFTNNDDVLHNVFTPDACAEKVNLGTWPKGESRDYTFEDKGCVSLMLCNVHPDMEAYVLVLQNPFYVQVDADGNYLIEDVPPGDYKVTAWHERLKNKTESVTVTEDGTATIDFALSRR